MHKALTAAQLSEATGCPPVRAANVVEALNRAMQAYAINTPARQSAFLAQVAHESQLFARRSENLNYRAARLRQVFPKYFPTDAMAARYGGKPEAIASRVYANRMGNGGEASGDGWRFRGRGFIQLTGRANYAECSRALGVDLITAPERLEDVDLAALSAAWFWKSRGCNELADAGDFSRITRTINGGLIGMEDRLSLFARAEEALA